jgi:hypothetical protein
VIDLSGRWNETDARLCAESLVSQALGGDWLGNFSNEQKRKPVVVVGLVRNNSHEHLDTEIFIKDVEKAFIKSSLIRLVQAGERRNELRGERADQQDFASTETMKKFWETSAATTINEVETRVLGGRGGYGLVDPSLPSAIRDLGK